MSIDKSRACNKSLGEKTVVPMQLGFIIAVIVVCALAYGQWVDIKRVTADESIHLSEPVIREAMGETFVSRVEHEAEMRILHHKLDAIIDAVGAHIDE